MEKLSKLISLDSEERIKRIKISKEASVKRDLIRGLKESDSFDKFMESHEFTPEQKEYILFNMNRLRTLASLTYSQFIGEYEKYVKERNEQS